jgi:hypothetical protein
MIHAEIHEFPARFFILFFLLRISKQNSYIGILDAFASDFQIFMKP